MTEPRYWCDAHHRFATEHVQGPVIGEWRWRCSAELGGIMIYCQSRLFVENRRSLEDRAVEAIAENYKETQWKAE